jgi:hypothetical protein
VWNNHYNYNDCCAHDDDHDEHNLDVDDDDSSMPSGWRLLLRQH